MSDALGDFKIFSGTEGSLQLLASEKIGQNSRSLPQIFLAALLGWKQKVGVSVRRNTAASIANFASSNVL